MSENELEDFILHLNREAMTYLKDDNYSLSLKTLKEAENLLKTISPGSNAKLEGITLNNFGCFYKRINKPNVALKFLKKACEKEASGAIDNVNLAGTLLNICAIYSQLGKHDLALESGSKALQLVEKCETSTPNLLSTLIIGYHNTAVEYEYLGHLKHSVEYYKSSWQCASKHLGESNALTQSILKSFKDAQDKLEKHELRTNLREQFRINGKVHSQEKSKNSSNMPTDKLLPKINPYINKHKANSSQKSNTHRRIASVSENSADLAQVRFLTGDRMQPMFKSNTGYPAALPRTVEIGQRTVKHAFSINREDKNQSLIEVMNKPVKKKNLRQEIIHEKEEFFAESSGENNSYRTASAPVNIDLGNLQRRIKNLQNQYEDFDKKVQPVKDKLPNLENYRIEKIKAEYQEEKSKKKSKNNFVLPDLNTIEINNKKNEEFEKFMSGFNDDLLEENIKKADQEKKNFGLDEPVTGKSKEFTLEGEEIEENNEIKITDKEHDEIKVILKENNSINEDLIPENDKKPDETAEENGEQFEKHLEKKENIENDADNLLEKIAITEKIDKNIPNDENEFHGELRKYSEIDETKNDLPSDKSQANVIDLVKNEEKKSESAFEKPFSEAKKSEISDLNLSLLSAQSAFRGKLARVYLQILHKSAIKIQKEIRRYQCRKIYTNIKFAVIFIQSYYRGYLVRSHLKSLST